MYNLNNVINSEKSVPKNFYGLNILPLSFLLLAIAFERSNIWPWYTSWRPIPFAIITILALIATVIIDNYYKRRINKTVQNDCETSNGVSGIIIFITTFISIGLIEYNYQIPYSFSFLTLSIAFIYLHIRSSSLFIHNLVLAVIFMVISLLPYLSIVKPGTVHLFGPEATLSAAATGILLVIAGIYEHMLFNKR
jgi:hypothetical protein